MFDVNKYTVGWICTITTELVAARLLLDAEHDADEYEQPVHDDYTYAFGSIKEHNVVIACLPKSEYGTSSAAAVARDMVRSFPEVRIALMVGITGGAPYFGRDAAGKMIKQDVRLGDVVVSTPTKNGQGGVRQYDLGQVRDGSFVQIGHINQPTQILLNAVGQLEAELMLKGHTMVEDIEGKLESAPLLEKFRRPTTDTLFHTFFPHPENDHDCKACLQSQSNVVARNSRTKSELDPMIHYGAIASGNTLLKDASIRDRLALHEGILCVEMEAAGLMNQVPVLAIQGICDYADSHKNDDWEGFAAMSAAWYARALLRKLNARNVNSEHRICRLQEDVRQRK